MRGWTFIIKKYDEAIKCYDKALEINPNNHLVRMNKGNALDALGRHEEAVKCDYKDVELNPKLSQNRSMK